MALPLLAPKPQTRKVWRAERPRGGPGYARVRVARGRALLQTRKWYESPKWRTTDGFWPGLIADWNNNRYAVPAYGPELVPNGNFADPTTAGWTTNGTNQLSIVDNALRITTAGTPGFPRANRLITTEPGKTYFFSAQARRVNGTPGAEVALYTSQIVFIASFGSTTSATFVTISGYFIAPTTSTMLFLNIASGASVDGDAVEFDNISLREVMCGDVGTDLILNGDFATNLDSWVDASTAPATVTHSSSGSTGALFTISGGNTPRLRQSITTVIGASYTLICRQFNAAAGTNLFVSVGTTAGGVDVMPSTAVAAVATTAWNYFSFIATSTTTWINFTGSGTSTATLDSVSVRQWSARPTLRNASFAEMFTFTASSTTARTYIDSAGIMQNDLAIDQPRFTWVNGKRQLILENQAINYCQQSTLSTISTISGGSRSTVSGVYGLTGALFTEDAATSSHFIQPLGNRTVTVGMNYTMSAIVRGTGRSLVQYTFSTISFPAGQWCNFDLTGAGAVSATGGTGTIRALTGQWAGYYYVTFTAVASVASVALGQFATITSMADTRMPSVAGLNAGAYEIYAYQMEENVTFASSHIPTSGTIVTRAIESCQFSALALAVIGRPAISGAVQAQGYRAGTSVTDVPVYWGNNGARFFSGSRSAALARLADGSGTVADVVPVANYPLVPSRYAFAMNNTGTRVSMNNNAVSQPTITTTTMTRTLSFIGRAETTSGPVPGDGYYDNVVLYATRVANAAVNAIGATTL